MSSSGPCDAGQLVRRGHAGVQPARREPGGDLPASAGVPLGPRTPRPAPRTHQEGQRLHASAHPMDVSIPESM